MIKYIRRFPWHYVFVAALTACNPWGADDDLPSEQQSKKIPEPTLPTEVAAFVLEKDTFQQELLANGKLKAVRRADLRFHMEGTIERMLVAEGDRVEAGQLLATLFGEDQQQALQQAKLRHEKAVLDYEDQLLRLGYRVADSADIAADVKRVAQLRSGLSDAVLELERARRNLEHTRLLAPFAGKVANVKASAYNSSAGFEYICTVTDDKTLYVEFAVLEQELAFVGASEALRIAPFSDGRTGYTGVISAINPQVDESGMVAIKGLVANKDGKLLDGMGVRVSIRQAQAGELVVPKAAVLDRQGRKVVFTATEGGTAYWNYVEIGRENSTHYTIVDGLKPGDRVIYDGNFNLAHDKPVAVVNDAR